jgi:hypothetical protein
MHVGKRAMAAARRPEKHSSTAERAMVKSHHWKMEDGMSSAYQHLALADVRPGMVLSDVLLDRQGQVLLPQGAVLTAPIIALLPRHGIEALAVLRQDADSAEAAPDYAMLQQRLAHLFRHNDIDKHDAVNHDDSATSMLRRYMEDYRLRREIEE